MGRHLFPFAIFALAGTPLGCGTAGSGAPSSSLTDGGSSAGTTGVSMSSSGGSSGSGGSTTDGGPHGGDEASVPSPFDGGNDRDASRADAGAPTCASWLGDAGAANASSWVYVEADGKLAYRTLPAGDRILDFSTAGYLGGGVALPTAPVQAMVTPAGGTADDTTAIQAAIDKVSALPLTSGFRGAVVLAAGNFNVKASLAIKASGVVLRGSGSDTNGTSLVMTAGTPFAAISVTGSGSYAASGSATSMTDAYVPSGAISFGVGDASGFAVGDAVLVHRPVTAAWVALMGMDKLVNSSGGAETWLGVGSTIDTDRTIAAISGNTITLDAPLSDSFDAKVLSPPGGSINKYAFAGRIANVGVEHLRIVGPAVDIPISMAQYTGITLESLVDAWVSDVVAEDTQGSFTVNGRAKRVTLDNARATHTVAHTGDMMADFSISGTQTLVNRSSSTGTGEWPIVTQGRETGPIVFLNFTTNQPAGIAPHQRWATGLLADSCKLPNAPSGTPGIAFWDRGTHGSGQGWTIGWGVAWNVSTPYLLMQEPPGSQNWCIGCEGTIVTHAPAGSSVTPPNGVFEGLGKAVSPSSLYLAQLCERLGPQALAEIGY